MRRLLTLLMVVMLAFGAGGAAVLAQDDGPSPDSPTRDRDEDAPADDEEEPDAGDEEATPESDDPVDDKPVDDEPLPEAPEGPLDLAAMTLDSEEIPEGYQLVAEAYIDPGLLAENMVELGTEDELEELGIVGYYESTYAALDGGSQIRSYVIEYPDVEAVEDGFALFEDEERMLPGETGLEDAPGPGGSARSRRRSRPAPTASRARSSPRWTSPSGSTGSASGWRWRRSTARNLTRTWSRSWPRPRRPASWRSSPVRRSPTSSRRSSRGW
jgi:hypothetical protein